MNWKSKKEVSIRSSTAEYLTYAASIGDQHYNLLGSVFVL